MDAPLNFNAKNSLRLAREESEHSIPLSEVVEQLTGFVRRQYPIFVFFIACSLCLGLVYLITTPPSFTSHAMLLIDSSKVRMLQEQGQLGDVPIDTAQVETQVEILKSENIAATVVKDLKLNADPEFAGSGSGLLGRILALVTAPEPKSETGLSREALGAFLAKRTVTRVGRTYVLDIGFTASSPARAAEIANAIADAYIVDQLESKYQVTKRASSWLQDRIKELRKQASDADRAVLDYKERNKIVSVGGNSPTGGARLLGEQQLEDLNTQLGTARAAAEETKARLDRINDVMHREVPDAAVADSLRSDVINRLRSTYLDLNAKEAIWSARYGSNHLAAVNLRTQMAELRRSIHDELGRIAESHKSDHEIAKSRVEGLERELQKLVTSSQVTNRDRLGLIDLESTAKIYHSIYDSFLQRYMEAIQQQSFPITEARVIGSAAPPQRKSSPRASLALGLAGIIGLLLGFVVALLREAVDRVFRTTRQLETSLNANCLAVLPALGAAPSGTSVWMRGASKLAVPALRRQARDKLSTISQSSHSELTRSSLRKGGGGTPGIAAVSRAISSEGAFMRQVIDEPLSAFAEAFRSIKVAADLSGSRKSNKVIGITSTVPGEGKSTISANLAQLIAHAGKQAILLDGDLRNPSLTRSLSHGAKAGLFEVLNGEMALKDAIYLDEQTGLSFLPAVVQPRLAHTNEILASESFRSFVDSLRKSYDYIIIDFPPIAPVVDVRATTGVVDSYIYVVQWGKTPVNLVEHQLLGTPEIHDRLLGVVLNKADVRVLERYESYYGGNYYGKYYGARESA